MKSILLGFAVALAICTQSLQAALLQVQEDRRGIHCWAVPDVSGQPWKQYINFVEDNPPTPFSDSHIMTTARDTATYSCSASLTAYYGPDFLRCSGASAATCLGSPIGGANACAEAIASFIFTLDKPTPFQLTATLNTNSNEGASASTWLYSYYPGGYLIFNYTTGYVGTTVAVSDSGVLQPGTYGFASSINASVENILAYYQASITDLEFRLTPEPTSLALLALGGLVLIRRARK